MTANDIRTRMYTLSKLGVDFDNCVLCMSDKEGMDIDILETDFGRMPVIRSEKLNKGEFAFLRKGEITSE